MDIAFLKMLFIASVSAQFGKHVYVQHKYTWNEAQRHCRDHYTDLSPITTWWVENRLKDASNGTADSKFWIGLYGYYTQWTWSGGGAAADIPWDEDAGEPGVFLFRKFGCVCWRGCTWNGWHAHKSYYKFPFFCFNLMVVETTKTWEEALLHCRETHTDLTSLASETEQRLALSEIKHDHVTQRVWIGLRYLADRWLWVNGDPLEYEAWSQGDQDHLCPIRRRCGALTKEGLWENWDCQEKLNFICY